MRDTIDWRDRTKIGFSPRHCTCWSCGKVATWNACKDFDKPRKCPHCGENLMSKKDKEYFDELHAHMSKTERKV